jgi:glycine cleavage system T protein (aminomethyltransferase)
MDNTIKKTPLYPFHNSNDAKMSNFGGYEMPLWYKTGPKKEHLAVIQGAGIFDTSHMAAITVSGDDAFALLQFCFSKDLEACIGPSKMPIQIGKCVYGVFLNEKGFVIDDSLVYQVAEKLYVVIVNAGMGQTITNHLNSHINTQDVIITDYTDKLGKIDVQGPLAARIVAGVIQDAESILEKMPYFNFKGYFTEEFAAVCEVRLKNGHPILLSRTGYTGEFGFEIFIEAQHTETLWNELIEAGLEFEVVTCGLAARDSLRAGAVLPLSHQDIGNWPFLNHPWPFALPYVDEQTGFTKDFIGAEALKGSTQAEFTYAFAGFDPRKVIPGADTCVVDENDKNIGFVLTCATDMAIGRHEGEIFSIAGSDNPEGIKFKGLSCGFIKTSVPLSTGDIVFLKGNNRKFGVEIRANIRPARTARKAMKKML